MRIFRRILTQKVSGGITWYLILRCLSIIPQSKYGSFHVQVIIVPDSWVPSNTNGFLWITGGSVTDGKPQVTDEDIEVSSALATGTGCITGMYMLVFRIGVR